MKKTKLLFLILLSLSIPSYAEEASPNENIGLRANFRRVALDYSKTNVDNAIQYRGSPITALNANNQSYFKGNLDFALEYEQLRYRWDNKIWANYGRTNIKTLSGRKTKSETADELIFTSDYSRKFWKLHNMDLGAFTSVEYQTEFTRNRRAPRNQVARGRLGMRLFNGKYITDLYATNVVEYDFTYAQDIYKYAYEIGTKLKYDLREGVKFQFEGYYRDYLAYSEYNPEDLEYDLNMVLRMDVKVTKILSIAPFISMRQAHSRGAENHARNDMIGISFVFSDMFKF